MKRPASDEELLKMLEAVEAAEDLVDEADQDEDEPPGDPCPACGEPAEQLASCNVCHEEGCLPRDEWSPGQRDPCMSLCVRCARPLHIACASEDGVGNPRCPGCAY